MESPPPSGKSDEATENGTCLGQGLKSSRSVATPNGALGHCPVCGLIVRVAEDGLLRRHAGQERPGDERRQALLEIAKRFADRRQTRSDSSTQ